MTLFLHEKSIETSLNPFIKPSIEFSDGNELVILVHGWLSSAKTMEKLAERLLKKNYCTYRMDLSTTFGTLDKLKVEVKEQLDEIRFGRNFKRVHFIAFSMGGLILKYILNTWKFDNLGRLITLGTPHLGSPLSKVVKEKVPIIGSTFFVDKADYVLEEIGKNRFRNEGLKFGLVAGNKGYLINKDSEYLLKIRKGVFSRFGKESDGTVAVSSALGMPEEYVADTIVLNVNHVGLVYEPIVFKYVLNFLKNGKFNSEGS
jgi:pimeloyl-ACP methyl ester carboxylesterase